MESKEFRVTILKKDVKGETHFRNVSVLMNSLSLDGSFSSEDDFYSWKFSSLVPIPVLKMALTRLSVFEPEFTLK